MAEQVSESVLEEARAALARYSWRDAYELLTVADETDELTAPDLEGLSQAAWWTGRLGESIAANERAFAAHMAAGDKEGAARAALTLAKDNYTKGAPTVGAAWLRRAEKLLADEPETVTHGYLNRLRAVLAFEGDSDIEKALAEAERAGAIGLRFDDADLQALALHDRGRIFVDSGRVAEGMGLMDEATAAAVSGELSPIATGFIYCNTISACEHIADFARAGEWTEAAKRWCERQSIAGFPGMCRVHRAGIMRLRGAWAEAEDEARKACTELLEFSPDYAAEALYELGEIRLRLGDLAGAEEALRQAHELGREPEPALALLRSSQGRLDAALSSINRALADESRPVFRARLLPARVEISVAAGDVDQAMEDAAELGAIAAEYGTPGLEAMAKASVGAVNLARDGASEAVQNLRRAVQLWQEIDAPYEAARTRLVLAAAYRAQGDETAAIEQAEAAKSALDRLRAAPDARRAADFLIAESDATGLREAKTFMFTDICASTALLEAMGDDAWQNVLRWHDETLRSLFAAHNGEEVKHVGDGFFVAFNASRPALECAIAIQASLSEHRKRQGFAPNVRIGVHAAEATGRGRDYHGKGVHEAARIGEAAGSGEIVASRETVAETGNAFRLSAPETVSLKGLAQPIEIVKIDWSAEI
jgi:class 3 adenylate cyclase